MTAREFFRQVLRAEKALKILNAKLEHFEELGLSLSGGQNDGMPGSGQRGVSRVELAAVGAVDAFQSIQQQQREYMAIIGRAEGIIQKIPQEKYQAILSYHYLLGKSFSWISDELGYRDQNSIYRAHGWALYEAQKIINRMEEGHVQPKKDTNQQPEGSACIPEKGDSSGACQNAQAPEKGWII